jgi:predicted acylesterase/phospholipase RssA
MVEAANRQENAWPATCEQASCGAEQHKPAARGRVDLLRAIYGHNRATVPSNQSVRACEIIKRVGLYCVLGLALGGCGSLPRNPVPALTSFDSTIPGLPEVRAWSGKPSPVLERDLARSFAQESAQEFPPGADGTVTYAHLALSGGGANGAFGAGYLNGWTTTGTRPAFKIVTGVSTGALMAPFAFVGPDYDDALRKFYTTTRSRDIFVLGSILWQLLAGEALADTRPLQALLEQHVDAELLRRVAEAHRAGRRLYIGTTNLDMPRFVVWNMGQIASSGRPDALALFRKVMLASASIPVAFPPVFFEVEVSPGGPRYDEMHVDGGVGARLFLNGGVFEGSVIRERGGHGGQGREDIFVIHNGQLIPQPDPIRRSLPAIAERVIDASGRAAATGDLFRIYSYARQHQARFQWITIPNDVTIAGDEVFDPRQMQALYELGRAMSQAGGGWATLPPGRRAAP